jgi:mannose-6-phosphate isomerase-like protein (cupin superfamily)
MVSEPVELGLPSVAEIPLFGYPDRPVQFVHDKHLDERLRPSAIADLADALPSNEVAFETAVKPLVVPGEGAPRGLLERPGDVIRNLDDAEAWLALLNAERDPDIADVMMSVLDELQPAILSAQGKMRNRGAYFFVASPNSVTPVHFDIEFSVLLQLQGTKTISFGYWQNDAVRRHEVNRYWEGSHGRVELMPEEMVSFRLSPGQGVYIPPCTPHWVRNGPNSAMSVTLAFHTAASTRERRVEDFNSLARRMHLSPREPGRSAVVDTAKIGAMAFVAAGRKVRGAPRALGAK